MDLETTKCKLTTTKRIYEKKSEYPIDCEFTLPDYCPDIERILKCNVTPRISNLSVLSDSAQVEINANVCILYVTSDDKLFGYEMPISISKTINVGAIEKETIKSYNTKTEYVNCRAVNNRKIDVHGSVSVFLKLLTTDERNYISDISDNSVVLKKLNEKVLEPCAFAEKQVNVADDIVLSQSSGSISNIIRQDTKVVIDECKTISNKAIVKLTLMYEILYLSSDLRYECIKHSVPVNQVIDIEGTDENSICVAKAEVCSVSLKPITNSEGEMRTINSNAKINICVTSSNYNDISVVTDGYCVKFESDVQRNIIECNKFVDLINENINISDCINVSSQISEIIDLNCIPLHFSCKTENDNTYIHGDIAICISLEDENGGCKYYEKVVTFSEKISTKSCDEQCIYELVLTPINCSYNISSGNAVDFKCEINVNGLITKPCKLNAVSKLIIDEEKEKSFDDMPSLVVYYGTKGESIWDIALKYNTSAELLCEANNINDENLSENTMLLIPCM